MKAVVARIALRSLGRLPLPLGRAAGLGIGALLWLTPNRSKRTTVDNIERCFAGLTAAERRRLARRSLFHTGRTLTDCAWTWAHPPATLLAAVHEVRGLEHFTAARAEGRGIIVVTPHLGCWEMVGAYFAHQAPMTCLYRPPRMAALEPVLLAGRQRTGARLAATDGRGIRALHRALRAGEVIGILPDQAPREGHGVIVPFFGQPARTMTLLSRLARGQQATVLYCIMERLSGRRGFRLHVLPASPEVADADEATAAAAVNRDVERCIHLCPEQYMWSYRRFRRNQER